MNKYSLKNLVIDFTLFLFILSLVALASIHIVKAETSLANRLSGKILLQVEDNGEAWYLNPQDNKRSYLGRPHDAYNIMREEGIGITNDNLEKIPLSLDNLSGKDSDSDKLPDNFEIAIGTDPNNSDTDSDGYDDYVEVLNNYSPKGDNAKRQTIDKSFAKSHQGKIFIQVEGNGEAWYVDTTENKRHYLGRPSDAFSIMRHLGLGISNTNLNQISIREGKGIQEYNYSEEKQEQQGEENKEEYKNHITVTTHKPELMREFSNIIHVSATINDSSGYDFKEKGFLFDYTMNKEEVLTPTLANHKEKLIDNSPGLSIEAEIDNLLPKSYPYIRAYVITAEDVVYYGNTEVLIMGNTETVDSIGAPGTPPMFGGGGGGGSSTPKPDPEPVYYDLIYTAGDNGYLATTAPEVIEEPEIPEWESETDLPEDIYASQGFADGNYIYYLNNFIEYGLEMDGQEGEFILNNDFDLQSVSGTTTVFRYDTVNKTWDEMASMPFTPFNPEFINSTYIDNYIYIFDGENFYRYNISSNSWETLNITNNSLLNVMPLISAYNNKIYMVGIDGDSNSYGIVEIDPETMMLSDVAISEYIFNDRAMAYRLVIANNNFHIFEDNLLGSAIYSYSFLSDEWEHSISYSTDMGVFGNLINYNGNILNIGGYILAEKSSDINNGIYLYIDESDSWVKILEKPYSGFYGSACLLNNHLYIGGGFMPSGESVTPNHNNYSIDLSFLTDEYINSLSDTNWQTKNPLPFSLTGAGSVNIDDTIYLIGGYSDDADENSPLIMSYDYIDDEWTTESMMPFDPDDETPLATPLGRVNPMTVNVGNDIYIFGGRTDEYGNASSSLKYNINTKEFSSLPDMHFEITNPFGGVYNDKIYIFGGEIVYGELPPPDIKFGLERFDKEISSETEVNLQATDFFFEVYNIETNSFEEGDIMPTSYGYGTEAIMVDGIFYIIGGHNDDWSFSNQTLSYNPETDTWNTLANLPQLRAGGSLAYNNGNIYYIGGFNDDRDNIKDNIYKYDISTNTWSELSDNIPQPLSKSSAQFIEDNLYVIGGWDFDWYSSDAVYTLEVIEEDLITLLEQSVLEGSNGSEVYAVANDGYQFDSWSDGNISNPRQDVNVQNDINVSALFTELPYHTLTYQADEGSHLIIGEETDWNNTYLPEEIYNPIIGLIGDKIYIFYQDLLLSYDPKNDTYINHSDQLNGDLSPYIFWNSRATELVYDNKLYYFGVGPNSSSSAMFNPETMTITRLADMPISRQGYAEYYNGEIYFFVNQNYDKFYIYNVEENTWREGGYSPLNYVNNIVKVDDKFYFATGNDMWFDRYYCYDPENNIWKELNHIEGLEIHGAGVNYTGDKILYIGALDFLSSEVETDNVFIYDISEDSWYISDYYHNFPYDLDDLILFEDNIYTPYDESIFSTSIYNFPFDEYSVEVREGDDGPNIYANTNILDSGTFLGWSDGETSNPRKDRNVQEDISVSSSFDIPEYTLTYSVGDNRYAYGGGNLVIASEQNDWVQNKDLPIEGAWQSDGGLYNIMSASVGSKIYIFGGYLNREQYKTIPLIYNTETDTYEEIDNENYDPEDVFDYRENSFDISIGDKIYSIGGRNTYNDIVASSTVFDTSTNTWSDISDPANEIYMGAIEVYNGEIYLFNGGYNTLEIYNPDTDTWRLSDTTPIPGIYDSELVDGVFFLQGREITNPETHEFTGQLSAYYPDTDTWEIRANDYATHIYSESYTNLLKYNSFQNDQGIIVYIEDGRYEIPWSGFIGSAVYDTTSYRSLNPDGNPIADDHYNWSQIPLLTDLTGYDYHVIDDYLYLIGGTLEGITKPINQKIPMINFPVNHYSETVKKGQNGPIVVPNNHPGADLFKWSDDDPATYGTPRQDTNIQEDINVEAYFGAYT